MSLLRYVLLTLPRFLLASLPTESAIQSPLAVLPCFSDADAVLPVLLSKVIT